jgi:hypothetical protein
MAAAILAGDLVWWFASTKPQAAFNHQTPSASKTPFAKTNFANSA